MYYTYRELAELEFPDLEVERIIDSRCPEAFFGEDEEAGFYCPEMCDKCWERESKKEKVVININELLDMF